MCACNTVYLTERLGVERIALVYGWSMGGQQAYHWAALYPSIVARIAVVCGSAQPHRAIRFFSKASNMH